VGDVACEVAASDDKWTVGERLDDGFVNAAPGAAAPGEDAAGAGVVGEKLTAGAAAADDGADNDDKAAAPT